MTLVYIENKIFLKRILYFLEQSGIKTTTDFNSNYSNIILAEMNNKTLQIASAAKLNKKNIIFLFYLEEYNFCYHFTKYNKISLNYKNKLFTFLNSCNEIVVSLPYFQRLLSINIRNNIYVIPKENPILNNNVKMKGLYKKYNLTRNKKRILVVDHNYQYLEWVIYLSKKKNDLEFIYIDYTPEYELTNRKKELLNGIPINLKIRLDYPSYAFEELLEMSSMCIYLADLYFYNYLLKILIKKQTVFIKNFFIFESYLVSSKNCYIFSSKEELEKEINKYIDHRIGNLTNKGYDLIKNNNFSQIVYMIQTYFK